MRSRLAGGRGKTQCLVGPFPRAKKPRPGNRAESPQHRAKAATQSGNLHCVPPKCRALQSRGTATVRRGGRGAPSRPAARRGCSRRAWGVPVREGSRLPDPQLCPHEEARPPLQPGPQGDGQGDGGRAGARLAGTREPSGRLQRAAVQLCPGAQRSWGLGGNQVGHEQRTFLDGVFLQMKTDECHQVCPLTASVFTG